MRTSPRELSLRAGGCGPDQQVPELRGQRGQKISGPVGETLRGGSSGELAGDCSQGEEGGPKADVRDSTREGGGGKQKSESPLGRKADSGA